MAEKQVAGNSGMEISGKEFSGPEISGSELLGHKFLGRKFRDFMFFKVKGKKR